MKVSVFLCASLCLASLFCPATAQTSESGMEPGLGIAFPFQQGAEQVLIKNSVMVNKECVIPAGSKARVIYIQPKEGDASVKKQRRKQEDKNDSYVRVPDQAQKSETMTPVERATYEMAVKTIWTSETAFRAALERMQREHLRFVYQVPGNNEPLNVNLEFPQGLLLMEDSGKIIVLSVVTDSAAAKAGIVAGTTIVSLNGKDLNNKLSEFQKVYQDAMEESSRRQLDFSVKLPKSDEVKNISVRLPMSLNSDMWSVMGK